MMSIYHVLFSIIFLFAVAVSGEDDVEKVFRSSEIIPDAIDEAPEQILKVSYANELTVNKGNELTPTQVKDHPTLDWGGKDGDYYTLLMVDPDAPSRTDPKYRSWLHWLVGNINGNDLATGTVLGQYIGSGPPKGTGLHRYVFLVYKQSGLLEFDEEHLTNTSVNGRGSFSTLKFINKYKLGKPVAGNFYQAQYDDYVPILYKQLNV